MSLYPLAQRRIAAIMDELQDVRQLPQNLLFTNRIPMVSAEDSEIMARYTGRVIAADIIADDQVAVVRANNPVRLQETKIPNLKHGEKITQAMMGLLRRLEGNIATARDRNVFDNYVAERLVDLRDGVYERMEIINVGMVIDAFDYNRMGIQISGTWGMPSDLKVTIATAWSDATNATPINDILAVRRTAREKYGINLDRVTLTTTDFLEAVATTEFRNKAALYSQFVLPTAGTFPTNDIAMMQTLAGRMTGMTWEIYDAQAWTESIYGTQTAANILPVGKIALTASQADNNGRFWDWANGVVLETVAAQYCPGLIGEFTGGEQEGPVSYATAGDPNLNPPGPILWAVARGYSRKHKEAASAVLTNP